MSNEVSLPPTPPEPAPEPEASRRPSGWELGLRFGVPIAVALLFSFALLMEGAGMPRHDLQLIAPSVAPPGQPVALRARVLGGLAPTEVPRPVNVPVVVEAIAGGGAALAQVRLEPSTRLGMEGRLELPEATPRELRLVARASVGDEALQVEKTLEVSPGASPATTRGRLESPLQQYALFPTRSVGDAVPPSSFEPRVLGGACVPERPCHLLVWVGEPAARVRVHETAAVDVVGEAVVPERPTTGLVPLEIVVHGAEADLQLVAEREGRPVARRTARLPIAQAMPPVGLAPLPPSPGLSVAPERPSFVPWVTAPPALLVDLYSEGHWHDARSMSADALRRHEPLPGEPLGPGLWRVQWRDDPFSAAAAGTRLSYFRGPGETEADALATLARRSALLGWNDPFAGAMLDGAVADEPPGWVAAYLLSLGELELVPLPEPASGYAQAEARSSERESLARSLAALLVVLLGAFVGLFLLRGGLMAQRQADAIVRAGDDALPSRETDRHGSVRVIAVALFVTALFLLVAAAVWITRLH
jgi:hypothetical protein